MQGMSVAGKHNLGMLQRQDLAAAAPVKQVLEAPELFDLMETLLQVSKRPVADPVCLLNLHVVCPECLAEHTCRTVCILVFQCCDILVCPNVKKSERCGQKFSCLAKRTLPPRLDDGNCGICSYRH